MKNEIRQVGDKFVYVIDGEQSEEYTEFDWCEDDMEDRIAEIKSDENDYVCDFCQEYFLKENVNQRLEDQSFTAPYGSVMDLIKNEALVSVCPICGDDLEECR